MNLLVTCIYNHYRLYIGRGSSKILHLASFVTSARQTSSSVRHVDNASGPVNSLRPRLQKSKTWQKKEPLVLYLLLSYNLGPQSVVKCCVHFGLCLKSPFNI